MKDIDDMSLEEIANLQRKCESRLREIDTDKVKVWVEKIKKNKIYLQRNWVVVSISHDNHGVILTLDPSNRKTWTDMIKYSEWDVNYEIIPNVKFTVIGDVPRFIICGKNISDTISNLGIKIINYYEIGDSIRNYRNTMDKYKLYIDELERVEKLCNTMKK